MKGDLKRFMRKEVEIIAHGILYKGVLIEISDEEILLKAETRWLTIVTSEVTEIKEPGKPKEKLYKMMNSEIFKLDNEE
jgi:hypothetical protein